MHYARTVGDGDNYRPKKDWQLLEDHLRGVSSRAAGFAAKFEAEPWGGLAGLWHDLGKYHSDFQRMLDDVAVGKDKGRVDHSTAGALLVWKKLKRRLPGHSHWLLTSTIAGHHGKLADGLAALKSRLEGQEHLQRLKELADQRIPSGIASPQPDLRIEGADNAERIEFLTRFVFSALVDADRLDAEAFQDRFLPQDQQRGRLRKEYADLHRLTEAVDSHIDAMAGGIDPSKFTPEQSRLHIYRQGVLSACRQAAGLKPGAFRLNVETGGGKTLSSLSFALRHAVKHGLSRVIVVIPFTSIIEQTAEVFRGALGAELQHNILEHHSAVEEGGEGKDDKGEFDAVSERRRLATENWDAPIVVTTAVQFFESLYSASASRCRKLHNIANSVVILDEAQTLPVSLLKPTVDAINQLTRWYGASVVLSTATQPALEPPFPTVDGVRDIIAEKLTTPPPRVHVEPPKGEKVEWPELAAELASHDQILCITHKRADARKLTLALDESLRDESAIHLSANMCAEHRSQVIQRIREMLLRGEPCRVVSTQLVEAGVDLDFPVVYRALGGIDAMIQAAGRCNREGKLGERGGRLHIFRPPTEPPRGLATAAKETSDYLLKSAAMDGEALDLFGQDTIRRYFAELYGKVPDKMDGEGITNDRQEFRFQEVQRKYRLIEDQGTHTILVPYGCGKEHVEQARRQPSPKNLRALQRFTVNVYQRDFDELDRSHAIEPLFHNADNPNTWVLTNEGMYDARFGLTPEGTPLPEGGV